MLHAGRVTTASFLASVVLAAVPNAVSDPVGIYAIIDRVELRPDATNPTTAVIWGVFARADGRGDIYATAERGYLYYALNPTNERATRAEWSDFQSVAGTGQMIGFGQRYRPTGRVRRPSEVPADADVHPLGFGIARSTNNPLAPQIQRELSSVPAPVAPADGARTPPGSIRLIARNVADGSARYVFEIETANGAKETSQPVTASGSQAAWSPSLRARAGETYTWRVWVVNGNWRGPAATASFRAGE
jgi:hypothetical protein